MGGIEINNDNKSSGGMSFCSVLTLIFIVLKLCGVIKWSWIWVLSPMWIGILVAIILVIIGVAIAYRGGAL